MNTPILIIGKPHSTKTTFLTQFYTKLVTKKSCLTLYKPVENITAIKEAAELLANGEETKPSPTDRSVGLSLPIKYNERTIDLYCPDYGGEQINHIINNREIDVKWASAINESDNWILFIRPTNLNTGFDLSNNAINPEALTTTNTSSDEYSISDQSAFIELLQIMLHSKGHNTHLKNKKTKLTVALTCWDEIETTKEETPKEKLNQFLPLLLNFIEANWEKDKFNIVGLSAQGFRLDNVENQQKYQIEGNESFGFLVRADGTKSNDITELISEAL